MLSICHREPAGLYDLFQEHVIHLTFVGIFFFLLLWMSYFLQVNIFCAQIKLFLCYPFALRFWITKAILFCQEAFCFCIYWLNIANDVHQIIFIINTVILIMHESCIQLLKRQQAMLLCFSMHGEFCICFQRFGYNKELRLA